jgi:hypothetical protein
MSTPYVTHSFTFPHIPYRTGMRHIHTPEQCVETYAVLPPGFRITRTDPPQKHGAYHTIAFRFNTAINCGKNPHHACRIPSRHSSAAPSRVIESVTRCLIKGSSPTNSTQKTISRFAIWIRKEPHAIS